MKRLLLSSLIVSNWQSIYNKGQLAPFFMKKTFLIGTSFLLGSFIAQASFAEESKNFYLSIGGGVAFPRDVEGDFTNGGVNIICTKVYIPYLCILLEFREVYLFLLKSIRKGDKDGCNTI